MDSERTLVPSASSRDLFRANPRDLDAACLGPSALSECPPSALRQPPDYGDEPPTYNKEELLYDAKSRERKTIFIRLLTSIFITVIVSLIVAAVVEKIHDHRGPGGAHEAPTRSVERITIASSPATSVAADAAEATAEVTSSAAEVTPSPDVQAEAEQPKPTSSRPTSARLTTPHSTAPPTALPTAPTTATVDCASIVGLSDAILVTSIEPTMTTRDRQAKVTGIPMPQVQDMAIFSFHGCLLTQISYGLEHKGAVLRSCTVACIGGTPEDVIRGVGVGIGARVG
ncbi:hypothetical protein HIM_04090 [Hirsutella minnesotensis 3608]|uniref:Uncharacterized protein n=1 Tax=Hirsutella minnesotensis 3608 TaxID=1043627 RepID=A0A0F7ZLG2_9HYPO|nr:hypothetical protein HIM_04090 [Hirsutella minnesotensis 3608]